MLLTYRHAALSSKARSDASQLENVADLAALLHPLLPIDPKAERNWRVWFSFWGLAIADPEFAAEQRLRVRGIIDRIADCLAADPRFAHLDEQQHPAIASAVLSSLIGIATQAIFDPEAWPPERQVRSINEMLTRTSSRNVDEGEE